MSQDVPLKARVIRSRLAEALEVAMVERVVQAKAKGLEWQVEDVAQSVNLVVRAENGVAAGSWAVCAGVVVKVVELRVEVVA